MANDGGADVRFCPLLPLHVRLARGHSDAPIPLFSFTQSHRPLFVSAHLHNVSARVGNIAGTTSQQVPPYSDYVVTALPLPTADWTAITGMGVNVLQV